MMLDLVGTELARKLGTLRPGVPIIVMTAHDGPSYLNVRPQPVSVTY